MATNTNAATAVGGVVFRPVDSSSGLRNRRGHLVESHGTAETGVVASAADAVVDAAACSPWHSKSQSCSN